MDRMNAILISDILPYYQLVLAADRNRAMIQLDNVIQGRWLHYWADYKYATVIGVKRQVEISEIEFNFTCVQKQLDQYNGVLPHQLR